MIGTLRALSSPIVGTLKGFPVSDSTRPITKNSCTARVASSYHITYVFKFAFPALSSTRQHHNTLPGTYHFTNLSDEQSDGDARNRPVRDCI
ncbi:hypothetical protein D3C73_1121410 [compost metagenome]